MPLFIQKGFTLIEMMVIVAIVGVLAAIALPSYDEYLARSQVGETFELLAGLKTPLAEYGWQQNSWPTKIVSPISTAVAGEIIGTLDGKYTVVDNSILGVYPNGQITATMKNNTKTATATVFLVTSDGGATWSCTGGTLAAKYRPQGCK